MSVRTIKGHQEAGEATHTRFSNKANGSPFRAMLTLKARLWEPRNTGEVMASVLKPFKSDTVKDRTWRGNRGGHMGSRGMVVK